MPSVVGESADGHVRVEFDSAGQVRDVVISEDAMTMSAARLSAELVAAVRMAQDRVAASLAGLPGADRVAAAAYEATTQADRRFGEIQAELYDLNRRAEREW